MDAIKSTIAKIIKAVAEYGAGTASSGLAYEPKVPTKIRK